MSTNLTYVVLAFQFAILFALGALLWEMKKELQGLSEFLKDLLNLQESLSEFLKDLLKLQEGILEVMDNVELEASFKDFEYPEIDYEDPLFRIPETLHDQVIEGLKAAVNDQYGVDSDYRGGHTYVSKFKKGPLPRIDYKDGEMNDEAVAARYFDNIKNTRE